MPSLINRVPPGLLSFLGIKALGQNPSQLSDELTPVLELGSLYLAPYSETRQFQTAVINAPGFFSASGALVPAGKIWVCGSISLNTSGVIAAATTYTGMGLCWNPTGTSIIYDVGAPLVTATAAGRLLTGVNELRVLPPGAQLGVHGQAVTVGTAQLFYVNVRLIELDI